MQIDLNLDKNTLHQRFSEHCRLNNTFQKKDVHAFDKCDYCGRKAAAVSVIFLATEDGPSLLFTKRSPGLGEHAGQISFPGGGVETSDPSIQSAALRETWEEIGIGPDELELWGPLPLQPVLDHWLIHPFAAWWKTPKQLKPNPAEVDRVIVVSLNELLEQHRPECWSLPDPALSCLYQVSGETLWGATARITGRLLDGLLIKK